MTLEFVTCIKKMNRIFISILFLANMVLMMSNLLSHELVDGNQMKRITVPVLMMDNRLVLSATFDYLSYGNNGISEEELEEIFSEIPEAERRNYPEYLTFAMYRSLREVDAKSVYEMWDPVYSRPRMRGGFEEEQKRIKRASEHIEYGDFHILGKSCFGPFVRIDQKVLIHNPENEWLYNTAFYYVKEDDQYFQTREIGRISLFGRILDFATQNSTEDIPSDGIELSEEYYSLHFDVNEELEPGSRVIYTQDPRGVEKGAEDAFGDCSLVLQHNFKLLDWQVGDEEDERVPYEYRNFFMEVLDAYSLRDEERIVGLWTEREGRGERSRIESLKERGEWPERAGSLISEDTIIKVLAETDHGTIIICQRSLSLYALFIVRDEEGKLRLSRNLGENYAGTIFRDAEFLDAVLNQIADNGAK